MKRSACALMMLCAVSILGCGGVSRVTYPVRWTRHVELAGLADIEATLDRPVVTSNGEEELILLPPGRHPRPADAEQGPDAVRIHSVREYLRYQDLEYYAGTTLEMMVESHFKFAALPAKYLKRARPSRESFVADLRLDSGHLRLPPSLGLDAVGEAEGIEQSERLAAEGQSWQEIWPEARFTGDETSLTVSDEGCVVSIDLLAWGDFNGDGIEDVLLFVTWRAVGGSMRIYWAAALTRLAADAPLTILSEF